MNSEWRIDRWSQADSSQELNDSWIWGPSLASKMVGDGGSTVDQRSTCFTHHSAYLAAKPLLSPRANIAALKMNQLRVTASPFRICNDCGWDTDQGVWSPNVLRIFWVFPLMHMDLDGSSRVSGYPDQLDKPSVPITNKHSMTIYQMNGHTLSLQLPL